MGKQRRIVGVLLTSVVAMRLQAAEDLLIRGSTLKLPLEVRVLIKEFENDSIQVSGFELKDSSGKSVAGDSLECRARKRNNGFRLLQDAESLLGNRKVIWLCQSATQIEPLLRPIRLVPRAGFLSMNGMPYRDALEIFPKENGKLAVVNALRLEDYLAGVVNKEIRSDFPREAIKAQIVAARSYALATLADRRKNRVSVFDLQSNEMDQMYEGSGVEDSRSIRFVKETLGQVLSHSGQVLRAFYHSSNGGFSEQPANVWGDEQGRMDRDAYLARSSPVDFEKSPASWQIQLSPQMGDLLFGVGRIKELKVLDRTSGQRVKALEILGENGRLRMSGADFRKKLGNRWLKSTLFWVAKRGNSYLIEGRGFGHGVGMSQLGARAMARLGKNYRQILKFYYPNAEVTQLQQFNEVESAPMVPVAATAIVPAAR